MKYRIAFIFGTRPEAIKLCPVVQAMRDGGEMDPFVCVTGQHREMLDQVLDVFGIVPDDDLELMRPNQSLSELTSRALTAIDGALERAQPDFVVVQGDTTTVFAAALSAFYRRIPVGHVEAGLRTWDKFSPFPEEINRVLATRLADLHFAPTETSRKNLLAEGVADEMIHVTGNTVIDALLQTVSVVRERPPVVGDLPKEIMEGSSQRPLVLVTGHRRENFGKGFENICSAVARLAERFPAIDFVYPVHLNPNVVEPVYRLLGDQREGGRLSNVHLIPPQDYLPFVQLMDRATLVLTDSGGVQEEAPSLGKPVLVLRDTTERPEAVEMGTVELVGTDPDAIVRGASRLLTDRQAYDEMARAVNPYGDGAASGRIVRAISRALNLT